MTLKQFFLVNEISISSAVHSEFNMLYKRTLKWTHIIQVLVLHIICIHTEYWFHDKNKIVHGSFYIAINFTKIFLYIKYMFLTMFCENAWMCHHTFSSDEFFAVFHLSFIKEKDNTERYNKCKHVFNEMFISAKKIFWNKID